MRIVAVLCLLSLACTAYGGFPTFSKPTGVKEEMELEDISRWCIPTPAQGKEDYCSKVKQLQQEELNFIKEQLKAQVKIYGTEEELDREGDSELDEEDSGPQQLAFLSTQERYSRQRLSKKRKHKGAMRDPVGRWPGGVINFYIDAGFPDPSVDRLNIGLAISHWERQTCIRFVEVPANSNGHALRIQPQTNNASADCSAKGSGLTGVKGTKSRQVMNLRAGQCTVGNIIHELGHVVGLLHAQVRADRDTFILVNETNIKPDKLPQYEKHTTKEPGKFSDVGVFDYGSIMMYSVSSANGINKLPPGNRKYVMRALKPNIAHNEDPAMGGMGQRKGLSWGDIDVVSKAYNCTIAPVVPCVCPVNMALCDGSFTTESVACQRQCRRTPEWKTAGCFYVAAQPSEDMDQVAAGLAGG